MRLFCLPPRNDVALANSLKNIIARRTDAFRPEQTCFPGNVKHCCVLDTGRAPRPSACEIPRRAVVAQLQEISELFAQLQIRPSVDTVFPLQEADAALKKIAAGGSRGKTILTVE